MAENLRMMISVFTYMRCSTVGKIAVGQANHNAVSRIKWLGRAPWRCAIGSTVAGAARRFAQTTLRVVPV